MVAARVNLFPLNCGPGSVLASEIWEGGGRRQIYGKGFCRLAAAYAGIYRASNTNGGLKVISATFPSEA